MKKAWLYQEALVRIYMFDPDSNPDAITPPRHDRVQTFFVRRKTLNL